jgi:Protein of unknown function (DUF2752).
MHLRQFLFLLYISNNTVNRTKKVLLGFAIIIALLTGIYVYSHFNPEEHIFFPKCPIYTLTGYECPGCGSQRALHSLFHGNIGAAFKYNAFIILLVPYVLLGIYIEYIANRTSPRIQRLRSIFFGKWAALILAVIIIIFTFLRNLL